MHFAYRIGCALVLAATVMTASAASALLTAGTPEVDRCSASAVTDSVTLFRSPSGGGRQLLATAWSSVASGAGSTTVTWFATSGASSVRAAELELAVLERLYAHVLEQDPAASFELRRVLQGAADPARARPERLAGPTQGDVLQAIALARQRAASDLAARGSPLKPVSWSVVSIDAAARAATQAPDPERVRVRVHDEKGQPIAGVTLTASRGADSICTARSDAEGWASCKLVDAHEHPPGADEEDAGAPIVVTFPGVVSRERILLPTTLKLAR